MFNFFKKVKAPKKLNFFYGVFDYEFEGFTAKIKRTRV